uniref:Leucine rich repeats-containing protein n=1 Tax=Spironucleus salmonicida TaxID=348837 RepID=V6LMQ7_9EUKA|eukprot:EST44996.1 Hypothetical protein SS50377_15015 [Spironucleus salmonicida]
MYPVITTLPSTLKTLILSNFQLNITDISFLSNLESLSLNQLDINSQKRLQDVCKEKISIYKYNEVQFESNFKLNLFHNPTEKQCKFPQNLLKITAKNCQIIDFKLGSLQKLQELIIDSNTIYCDDLELPKCLLSLSINSCNIDSFDFRKLNLIEINASNNVCKTCLVPTNIQKLNLSGNIFLKQLNFPLFNLTHLNLENCTKLYIQTEQIGKNINFLNLSKTRIRHIDINIYTNLQTCILRNNSLDYMFVYKKRKSKIDVSGTEFRLTPIIINSSLSGHSAENSVKFPINCRRLLQNHEILRNDSAIARRAELVVKITDLQNKLQALIDQ